MNSTTTPIRMRSNLDANHSNSTNDPYPPSPDLARPVYAHHSHNSINRDASRSPLSLDPSTFAVMAVQSDAERAREKGLKDDPLALVISPSQVQCRQCKKLIKLSSKSAYDPFHWRNHRTRCVKLSKAKAKMTKKPSAPKSSSSSPAHQTASNRPLRIAASPGETRSVKTPPLTSDSEDDRRPERFVESHSPLGRSYASSSQSPTPATPQPGFSTNKYIHPDYVRRPGSVSVGHWQSWSWSQLKPRQFSVAYEYGSGDDMSDDLSDSLRGDDDPEDRIRQDAARSLSLLSQSNERNHGSSVDFSLPL